VIINKQVLIMLQEIQ